MLIHANIHARQGLTPLFLYGILYRIRKKRMNEMIFKIYVRFVRRNGDFLNVIGSYKTSKKVNGEWQDQYNSVFLDIYDKDGKCPTFDVGCTLCGVAPIELGTKQAQDGRLEPVIKMTMFKPRELVVVKKSTDFVKASEIEKPSFKPTPTADNQSYYTESVDDMDNIIF